VASNRRTILRNRQMPQPNDLSRSLVAFDQNSTIIAVVELSHSSWLVGAALYRQMQRRSCHFSAARPIASRSTSRKLLIPQLLLVYQAAIPTTLWSGPHLKSDRLLGG